MGPVKECRISTHTVARAWRPCTVHMPAEGGSRQKRLPAPRGSSAAAERSPVEGSSPGSPDDRRRGWGVGEGNGARRIIGLWPSGGAPPGVLLTCPGGSTCVFRRSARAGQTRYPVTPLPQPSSLAIPPRPANWSPRPWSECVPALPPPRLRPRSRQMP
eukprot:scaffold110516_cov27-Tisochrysis_lutea.AAC.1